jgi:uncharacterized membrane protein YphA (DoxX/SURF4 family)
MFINYINRIRQSDYLSLAFRVVVGIVFLFTGLTKVVAPGDFALTIQNYQIIPEISTNLIAVLLPWLEIFGGILLLSGLFGRGSALLLAALTIVFIIALTSAYLRGLNIECGCYGQGTKITLDKILLDVGLLLACLHLIKFPAKKFALDHLFKRLS